MAIRVKENSIAFHLLLYLNSAEEIGVDYFITRRGWIQPPWCRNYKSYVGTIHRLCRDGCIQIISARDKKTLRLTKKGEMQLLMAKARMPRPEKWDGKWRVIFFDIPEENKVERQQLRRLLLKNEFRKMQASVYVSPWTLNREAIGYLKETGLIEFIRFGKLEELDDDTDLIKLFKLN